MYYFIQSFEDKRLLFFSLCLSANAILCYHSTIVPYIPSLSHPNIVSAAKVDLAAAPRNRGNLVSVLTKASP